MKSRPKRAQTILQVGEPAGQIYLPDNSLRQSPIWYGSAILRRSKQILENATFVSCWIYSPDGSSPPAFRQQKTHRSYAVHFRMHSTLGKNQKESFFTVIKAGNMYLTIFGIYCVDIKSGNPFQTREFPTITLQWNPFLVA